jgi:two-component system sensor histidine kinase AlgZ
VIGVVVIAELVAIVLTLARAQPGDYGPAWTDLAATSFFLLWIGLISAAFLCKARPHLARLSVPAATAVALGGLVLVTGLVSEAGWWLTYYWDELRLSPGAADPRGRLGFLASNLLICLVVSAMALRYFYVSHQWRRNVELEAAARVNALQARIRPHFLFNSMNTIAALTRRDPAAAEEAVEDLADLFRASLRDSDAQLTLKEELEIARLYQRIEQLRLGERLTVNWQVSGLPMRARIPGLSLQPLLENAIYHGVEPRIDGGTIEIRGALRQDGMIELEISNPLPDMTDSPRRQGNRIALRNIVERFELAYGGRATVRYGVVGDRYEVELCFPWLEQGA